MTKDQMSELELYDYWPYHSRPKIRWPGGAKLAFWVAPNIEFYELNPPPTRFEKHGLIPFQRYPATASGTMAIA